MSAGGWNHQVVVLGKPGMGKSTRGVARAHELGKGSYLLGHDPGRRMPDRLPGGKSSGIIRYRSVADAAKGFASKPRAFHVVECPDAEPVIALAKQIAAASAEKGSGAPVTLVIDEAVMAQSASVHRLGDDMRELMASRRWLNVGLVMTCQTPRLLNNNILALATEIEVFRLTDARDLRRLEELGFEPDELAKIRNLPKYQSVTKVLG